MIWDGNGFIRLEEYEPSWRSCWECNPSHLHMKNVNTLYCCFVCGRYWLLGHFVPELDDDEAIDKFFGETLGLKIGESSSTKKRVGKTKH